MRYLSESFKEMQDELIRPALSLFFEIATDVDRVVYANYNGEHINFDDTKAPVVPPKDCTNEYMYAVVGADQRVDDARRICAPTDVSTEPTHGVPYGVTAYTPANTDCLIGSDTFYYNFQGMFTQAELRFSDDHHPQMVTVEYWDNANSVWVVEDTIVTLDDSPIYFMPADGTAGRFRRFKAKATTPGRFQLQWIKSMPSPTVKINKNRISSVMINQETDLTSQTLPSYEMTVTCIDVDGIYKPGTSYWGKSGAFRIGSACYFYVRKTGNNYEQIPLMYGKLTQEPTYGNGKITFKVAVDWSYSSASFFKSIPNDTLTEGDIVDSRKYYQFLTSQMFDSYDVFHGAVDEWGSEVNYYGIVNEKEMRQRIANALGCYIIADVTKKNLLNANDIQYKPFQDVLTRYEQIQNTLENRPKVKDVSVTRYQNTLSSEYIEIEASEAISATISGYNVAKFLLPFYAFGKVEIVDAQAGDPSATITFNAVTSQNRNADGLIETELRFTTDTNTTIQPIVRFYEVNTEEFEETETIDGSASETYINDNYLISNGYNAGKAKRVAKLMSNVSGQYEIDVIQNFAYEAGDVIRIETEKGVFKTCVITGLKFNLPGSKGHVTARKIFAIEDAKKALYDMEGVTLIERTGVGGQSFRVTETANGYMAMGKFHDTDLNLDFYVVVGATKAQVKGGGDWGNLTPHELEDYNKHVWYFFGDVIQNSQLAVNIPVYDLGTRPADEPIDIYTWGGIKLTMTLYEEQGMSSPLDWDNYEIVN